jgi:hypothetical protein
MSRRRLFGLIILVVFFLICCCAFFMLPPLRDRLSLYTYQAQVQLFYLFNPPQDKEFKPNALLATIVQGTLQASAKTAIQPSQKETLNAVAPTYADSPTPSQASTALPGYIALEGVRYETQHGLWNYCAPANMSMALSYWGWQGTRADTGQFLKPYTDDKNVMPSEMADYVIEKTDFDVVLRYGGNIDLVKSMVAAGYPVLLETGVYIESVLTKKPEWSGHYVLVTGYDDEQQQFITQDSYYKADYPVAYKTMQQEWRSFNNLFLVIYPLEKKPEVINLLGSYSDLETSKRIAVQKAEYEITQLSGMQLFFAKFNRGTSLVLLGDYQTAAATYDDAFRFYSTLDKTTRPWRMMWYQDGPYTAYFFTGRYQDVIDLANQTLDILQPYLEESFYWRARANFALGNKDEATADFRESLRLHPGYKPSLEQMQILGITNE